MTDARQALVVDDNDINRLLAARLLSKAGWQVSEAETGEEALDWLQSRSADLVLLDISMPTMSGEEVCHRIRSGGLASAATKLIAYTAHAMLEEREKFKACGFDAVLVKPISKASLAALLAETGYV